MYVCNSERRRRSYHSNSCLLLLLLLRGNDDMSWKLLRQLFTLPLSCLVRHLLGKERPTYYTIQYKKKMKGTLGTSWRINYQITKDVLLFLSRSLNASHLAAETCNAGKSPEYRFEVTRPTVRPITRSWKCIFVLEHTSRPDWTVYLFRATTFVFQLHGIRQSMDFFGSFQMLGQGWRPEMLQSQPGFNLCHECAWLH